MEPEDCTHENVEFEAGNYVPPYGWEIPPGYYCVDCGEMMEGEPDRDEPDPDLLHKIRQEEGW